MPQYDIVLLTETRYIHPVEGDAYIANIFLEDRLLRDALEHRGLRVHRVRWDDPQFDWSSTRFALFRTTWDYFHRFAEFSEWLDRAAQQTQFLNPLPLVRWNLDKHYLGDLQAKGINIVPTLFIEIGDARSLAEIVDSTGWEQCILKPAISGTARHTYRVARGQAQVHEDIFRELIAGEAMLVQEFQSGILSQGENTYVLMGGKFSHAITKRAKDGDFRVQDDFGGKVYPLEASEEEKAFAERALAASPFPPIYARVDVVRDNQGKMAVMELEMIEPELWMRNHPPSADAFAEAVLAAIQQR